MRKRKNHSPTVNGDGVNKLKEVETSQEDLSGEPVCSVSEGYLRRLICHLPGDVLPSDHPGRIDGRDMSLTTRYPDEETYKESHWT